VTALYDSIGTGYDGTRRADPAIAATLAQLLRPHDGASFLDLGCGTGNYTRALAALGGTWHGLDVSRQMLDVARQQPSPVHWLLGEASALPYAARHFDGVMCSLAIHHFAALPAPFAEVARVLADGPFVIYTAFAEQMRHYWLGHYFPQMMRRSIEQMPTRQAVVNALRGAGFDGARIVPFHVTRELRDLFLYSGKHRPGLYLDAAVRANISSFARLCPAEELQHGLSRLRRDIDTGRFAAVAARFGGDAGDYALVIARKMPG
jgi:ubiquinone/menaquinone biosynthesis C-methylase UbiE